MTSGAICILRNPRDVAISLAYHIRGPIGEAIEQMGTAAPNVSDGERSVYEVWGSWSQHVDRWTRKSYRAIYVMRCENMLADPFRIFGGLARHLMLRRTDAQSRLVIWRSSFGTLKQPKAEKGFREKPENVERVFRERKSGRWHEILSRRRVREIV